MKNQRFKYSAVIVIAIAEITGCNQQAESSMARPVVVDVEVDEEKVDLVDHYLEIDKRAFVGVKEVDANKALNGDGPIAVAIGNAFADANHLTEARFWYRIAAENGDAIGMTHMAIAARDMECRRANYWLEKALTKGGLGERSEDSMKASLKEYKASCK